MFALDPNGKLKNFLFDIKYVDSGRAPYFVGQGVRTPNGNASYSSSSIMPGGLGTTSMPIWNLLWDINVTPSWDFSIVYNGSREPITISLPGYSVREKYSPTSAGFIIANDLAGGIKDPSKTT